MHDKPNTNYSLRQPTREEVKATFGTFQRAIHVTGGDIPALLWCIHNPTKVPPEDAPAAREYEDGIAPLLREWAREERDEAIVAAWKAQTDRKPRIAECMRVVGCCREVATRVLREQGCVA